MASGLSWPRSRESSGSARRSVTARARRSSSGASSRKAYGIAFSTWCENADGCGVSFAYVSMTPASMSASTARSPSTSIASVRQSRSVSNTSGWSGTSMSPGAALSWHATCAGNTAARRSSERIRWIGAGTFRPPVCRSSASAREASHRHRVPKSGACSTACVTTSRARRASRTGTRPAAGTTSPAPAPG